MTDKEDGSVKLDIPYFRHEPQQHVRAVKWCDGHWTALMFALNDRNLGSKIARSVEERNERFARGETDPCWDACNMINIGALQIFGVERILGENAGCPACAFANIIEFAADNVALKYGETH